MVNSLYGKMGQNPNQTKTLILGGHEAPMFYSMVFDPDVHVIRVISIRTDEKEVSGIVELVYESQRDGKLTSAHDWSPHAVHMAAFVTDYARLWLYEALQKLGQQVMYCDTDSVIFRFSQSKYDGGEHERLEESNFLGGFKNELPDDRLVEFVTGGPKNYAYVTESGKSKSVVKGLRASALLPKFQIKFLRASTIAIGLRKPNDGPAPHLVRSASLLRDRALQEIRSQAFKYRMYKMVNEKVQLFADGCSLPFGHRGIELHQRWVEAKSDHWNRQLDLAIQECVEQRQAQTETDQLPGERIREPERAARHDSTVRMADRIALWRSRLARGPAGDPDVEYNEREDEWMLD